MRISNKQKQEIDFLSNCYRKFKPCQNEIEEFLNCVVHGKINLGIDSSNKLFQSKRSLEIMTKMWKPDLKEGIITIDELKEDFNHPYLDKIIR